MNSPILRTLVIALVGVAIFIVVGLPLPWLLGPMFACLAAALLGVDLRAPERLCAGMRTILGVAVGASITPAVVVRLPDMAASIALIPPFILLIGLIGYPYFRKLWGFDPATSYYAAMPGGLQDMLVFGEEAGGSARVLSLVHATRVLVIISLLPLFLTEVFDLDLSNPPGKPLADVPFQQLALMAVIAIAGWRIAAAIGMFGAAILGPMILATIASLAGLIDQRPPAEAILAAQFFIGIVVGVRYIGLTVAELRRIVVAGLGFTLVLAVLSVIFMEIVILLGLSDPVDAILAFSPGGQAEMTVIALIAGADVAYVVTHHLTRLITVIIGAPLVGRWLR
ncbi:AbrB family transcriptional regulator [Ruegeria sp. 2205SS24-7]|uniref:AbrB family transcriptional regulator n=1 Tax=Ruegeria discodermiae TaxID=3064389 RepID=UPI0027405F4E|nr:AbrB family transcriptional regulator [Ruegeria sp. 2205SS24-7]MDP5217246.1 AbrB family transcriptional regulator [Ruegeria sp. 2205SS24-7]